MIVADLQIALKMGLSLSGEQGQAHFQF